MPISPTIHFLFALATDISMPNHFGFACRRATTTMFAKHFAVEKQKQRRKS